MKGLPGRVGLTKSIATFEAYICTLYSHTVATQHIGTWAEGKAQPRGEGKGASPLGF